MFRESVTSIQALIICGITFSWGLSAGNKSARPFASTMMIIFSILLLATM